MSPAEKMRATLLRRRAARLGLPTWVTHAILDLRGGDDELELAAALVTRPPITKFFAPTVIGVFGQDFLHTFRCLLTVTVIAGQYLLDDVVGYFADAYDKV